MLEFEIVDIYEIEDDDDPFYNLIINGRSLGFIYNKHDLKNLRNKINDIIE